MTARKTNRTKPRPARAARPGRPGHAAQPADRPGKRKGASRSRTAGKRPVSGYGTGFDDRLEPTVPVDLRDVHSVSDLVDAYGRAAIGARNVAQAADILYDMVTDKDCYVVLTISGAMTVAKMGLVVCEMIESGMVQAVVSTGALMAHGFVEASGRVHFKYDPTMNDEALFERGYNRVYDTIELEQNLDDVEHIVSAVLTAGEDGTPWCSSRLHRALGKHLSKHDMGRGILRSAYEHDVPVYVPAFTDSELGLDFSVNTLRRLRAGKPRVTYDPFLDLEDYRSRIEKQKHLGIFTIGGGVPRNWAQQVGPYLDILQKRAGIGNGLVRFQYGVRICPEPVHWGGLSGCTYQEGVSWGKFMPISEGGRYAEVFADATIVWPIVTKAVLERLAARRKR